MKHNNQLPNGHFHKQWARRVRTWLDQAGAKKSRRNTRATKAALVAPRPTEALRPAVRCQTVKYNRKVRAGRGFTLDELKAAGVSRKVARTVGICVDHRRRNRSEESLEVNKARLASYMSRLIVFPKNAKAPKKGDSSAADCAAAAQQVVSAAFPVSQVCAAEAPRKVSEEEKNFQAYASLRKLAGVQRHAGIRAKRAIEKAEQEAASGKK